MTDVADSGKPADDASSGGTPQTDLNADGTQKTDSGEPDRFAGKSREEILKMYQEKESHFDKKVSETQAEYEKRIETLEKDLQAYQSWYQQQQAQAQPQAPQQNTQDSQVDQSKLVDALLEDPMGTINQMLDYRDQRKAYQEAWTEGPTAYQRAKKERPDIFEGVDENRLQQLMYGGIQSGTILPHFAKNPEAWKFLAGNTRLAQNDYRFQAPSPTPPAPPQGDLPPATKPQVGDSDESDDIMGTFNEATYDMMKAFGIKSKEEAAKKIASWRKNPDPRMGLEIKE